MAETADGQDDQSRIEFGQPLGGESESIENSGAEVLHENVGAADKIFEGCAPAVGFEVERDRLLVPVRGEEVRRFPLRVRWFQRWLHKRRPPPTGVVATVR